MRSLHDESAYLYQLNFDIMNKGPTTYKHLLGIAILCILGGITFQIFWQEQARFLAPTPVPSAHQIIPVGTQPNLGPWKISAENKLTLLHFYNPDCPCSRFNRDHLEDLMGRYKEDVQFIVVVQDEKEALPDAFRHAQAVYDADGKIADLCGVYSTPQAIVLDQEGKIVYRGNYNRARYCSTRDTWFTEMVIKAKLAGQPIPVLPDLAYQAYGCNLPSDEGGIPKRSFSSLFFGF